MMITHMRLQALIFVCSSLYRTSSAAIFNFDLILSPSQETVLYNDGYIRGPGLINLTDLTFSAVSNAYSQLNDDDAYIPEDVDDTVEHHRSLFSDNVNLKQHRNSRHLDGGIEKDASFIDIAIFPLPSNCAHSKEGCDWSAIGVGKRTEAGALRWCCTSESASLGLCKENDDNFGRLMIDDKKYAGEVRFLSVPHEGPMSKHIRVGEVPVKESGTYVVLYANCNPEGRDISIKGKSIWKSKHGYLPGELFGFMYFYIFVTCLYCVLFLWYGYLMHCHKEARIEIEKWINFSIGLGFLEMTFRSLDYFVWNKSGVRSSFVIWMGLLIGLFKQGISRCLAVMVAMGWGVSRDSLPGMSLAMSVGLALAYIFTAGLSDYLIVFALEHMSQLSTSKEKTIVSFASVLGNTKYVVDLFFVIWILVALSKTLRFLEVNNEKSKLDRMQHLRNIFVCEVILFITWMFFRVFDRYKGGIVAEEHAWAKDAATEVNYLFILIGIAILWRPNDNAQNYAYFKQLSPMDYDGDEDDLELSDMNG